MHTLCALSTLFLIAPTTVTSPSTIRNASPHSSLNAANAVLRQASSFMNGGLQRRRQHEQDLSFKIVKHRAKLGDGLVSSHPSRGLQPVNSRVANETNANDTGLLLPATNPPLDPPTANVIPFPVPNTSLTLMFGFLGDAIPHSKVWAAFEGVHSHIFRSVARYPDSPVPGNQFEYTRLRVRILVLANGGYTLTWQQLSWILAAMYDFITGEPEHYQRLTCDIVLADHGSVGFASVLYYPGLAVTERATAISSPPAPTASEVVPYPVPDTSLIINFSYLGTSIPQRDLDNAIWAALAQIGPSYRGHGTDAVPGNHFFRAGNGIQITIFGTVPRVLSWVQLYDTLWGLMLFVTGADGGEEHHRVLTFDVDDVPAGKLAHGALRYAAPREDSSSSL